MSRNIYSSLLYRVSALLSQRVSVKDTFFKDTALMSANKRIRYAILYWMKETNILNEDITKLSIDEIISKYVLPLIQRLGQAEYKVDVLTNLGFKVGEDTTIGEMDIE